jgi:hypothetical protein
MHSLLLVGLLLSFLVGCASGPSISQTRIRVADREFREGNGTFVFKDVILDESALPGFWIMTGFVHNNTGRNWKKAVFNFQLYDMAKSILVGQDGNAITTRVYSLNDGEVQSFSTNYFKAPPRPDALRLVWKYEVTHSGDYAGKQIFVMTSPWENRELLFEDQAIRIQFSISEKQIGMILQNKMPLPIKVDWNNISYVDITGVAHRVMHTGVRYIERDRPQVPTVIPPAAMIQDVIIPSDHIAYTSGPGGRWSSRSLFPGLSETDRYVGSSFSVFMPLELEGAIKNYLFSFRIEREAM